MAGYGFERKCANCGKKFSVCMMPNYAHMRSNVWFCSYSCFNTKPKPKDRRKKEHGDIPIYK